MVSKQYFNCRPMQDDAPTFYDGVGFEFFNGTNETVYIALESNRVLHKNIFGYVDNLADYVFGIGVYDPKTVVKVRPRETKILWNSENGCGVPNAKCDGTTGREIVMLRQHTGSMPLIFNFSDDYKDMWYCPATCCEEFVEKLKPCSCDCGSICLDGECTECSPKNCE